MEKRGIFGSTEQNIDFVVAPLNRLFDQYFFVFNILVYCFDISYILVIYFFVVTDQILT